MKTLPILFQAPMVRAILDGRKTVARRPAKGLPQNADPASFRIVRDKRGVVSLAYELRGTPGIGDRLRSPYGGPEDGLWVRETFALRLDQDDKPPSQDWWKSGAWYRADGDLSQSGCAGGRGRWRPSIRMPRWAARITLEVTDIRVERVQAITEADAQAEGVRRVTKDGDLYKFCIYDHSDYSSVPWSDMPDNAVEVFAAAWDGMYRGGPYAWERDPWVWRVAFRRVEPW